MGSRPHRVRPHSLDRKRRHTRNQILDCAPDWNPMSALCRVDGSGPSRVGSFVPDRYLPQSTWISLSNSCPGVFLLFHRVLLLAFREGSARQSPMAHRVALLFSCVGQSPRGLRRRTRTVGTLRGRASVTPAAVPTSSCTSRGEQHRDFH